MLENDTVTCMECSICSVDTVINMECENCKRRSVRNGLQVEFGSYRRNILRQRKKFRFVRCSRNATDMVTLCSECSSYLIEDNGNSYHNMWPGFLWYVLSDSNVQSTYGMLKWNYIPDSIVHCWEHVYHEELGSSPKSYFKDITNDIKCFNTGVKHELLSQVADVCNKYLMPTVLCPWGCTEYLHRVGKLPLDILLQRFLQKVRLDLIHNVEYCAKLFSAREDFIRVEYEKLLLNPKWVISPCWSFIINEGPYIHTCGDHDGGTLKKYLHLVRNPFEHNLPSNSGDQLCHAVLKPRSIKPMKANKYSNSYQMHEQRGCFNGIDTCSITSVGDFSCREPVLDEHEALSITHRSDTMSLLQKLEKERVLCVGKADEMKKDALSQIAGLDVSKFWHGSTFISMEDAIYLQEKINRSNYINVVTLNRRVIRCKRNWMQQIVFSQIYDVEKFGCQFSMLGPLRHSDYDTKFVWFLGRMLTCVKELWKLVELKEKDVLNWDGWYLGFFSKQCFKEEVIRSDHHCPFRSCYLKTLGGFLRNLENKSIRFSSIRSVMEHLNSVNGVLVLKLSDIFLSNDMNEDIVVFANMGLASSGCELVEHVGVEFLERNLLIKQYELRFIGCTIGQSDGNQNVWNGNCFMRHGGVYTKWWTVSRHSILPTKVHRMNEFFSLHDLKFVVYVKVKQSKLDEYRNLTLQHIGGQTNVKCKDHLMPLIVMKENEISCCNYSNGVVCGKKSYLGCPCATCKAYICKDCFRKSSKVDNVWIDNNFQGTFENENFSDNEVYTNSSYELSSCNSDNSVDGSNVSTYSFDEESSSSHDLIDDFFVGVSDANDYGEEFELDVEEEPIVPSTDAGELAFRVTEGKGDKIDGHVILNHCGSLLCRTDNHLNAYRTQKHFLQRLASTVDNHSIPLLYPEAMMFPSIFWSLHYQSGSFPGALPSSFLASKVSYAGFASIKSHINVRLTNQYSSSSTSPHYISFMFDILSNMLLNSVDSRIIIARGLTCEDGNIGIRVKSPVETCLHDTIDSKQMVKNLCASQKYLPMHFFLTFTVNQMEHFGVKNIKRWVDSKQWTRHFSHYQQMTEKEKNCLYKSMEQAAGPLMLRNWMETKRFLIDYIYSSPKSPYSPVNAIFARDEYQSDKGNLPHIHLILSVKMNELSDEQKFKLDNLIRASICSIRTAEEVNDLIDEGVINSHEEFFEIHSLAKTVLSHKCDKRCLRRVGPGDGPENFRCRKLNNSKVSPDNTSNSYISIESKRSKECIDQLVKIGLADPIKVNKFGATTAFNARHNYFHPKRHIPPTNPNDTSNISPVEGYTFSILKSMQNVQSLTHTNGLTKYVCKYVCKIDEHNRIIVSADPHDGSSLRTSGIFLHNTKITSSHINEEKALKSNKDNLHPSGRKMVILEMIQMMLSYPQVQTDMRYAIIATLPLEQRAGVERVPEVSRSSINNEGVEDGIVLAFPISEERKRKNLAPWRLLKDSELITLEGALASCVSIDKVTIFSLRPPELREIVTQLGSYYRWFYIEKKKIHSSKLGMLITSDVHRSCMIDSLQRQVFIRKNALGEIMNYLDKLRPESSSGGCAIMYHMFKEIYRLMYQENKSLQEKEFWSFIEENIIFDDNEKHLIIPVFSYVKPTLGIRFILHVLLSLGHFETELDLLLHPTLRDCFRYAKLIGNSNDPTDLQKYSNDLQKLFIEEQLVYFPNGSNIISSWIVVIGELFDGIIVRDEIPISDMPPVIQTALEDTQSEHIKKEMLEMRQSVVIASFHELDHVSDFMNLPAMSEIMNSTQGTPCIWNPLVNMQKTPFQSYASYKEQRKVLEIGVDIIDQYCDGLHQSNFLKSLLISGSPGTGKTFLEICLVLYAMSKGLVCSITAVMAKRAVQLGGKHIHKLFCLPGHNKYSLHRLAEVALIALCRKSVRYYFLKKINILFIDEIGQVSSELLGSLDIILRKIRNNDIFLGGLLIICTIDQKQLSPVKGKPFLTSPHVLTCFKAYSLCHSVRAHLDPKFAEIQNISRMSSSSLKSNISLVNRFKELVQDCCTFVSSWRSPLITPEVHRIYGKKKPAKQASREYVNNVKSNLKKEEYVESVSVDVELTYNSHEEWQSASNATSDYLDNKIKQPRKLLFFKGALFMFTYNEEKKFSQSQIGLIINLPRQEDVDRFKKIPILVAPPGIRDFIFTDDKCEDSYVQVGWKKCLVGIGPENTYSVQGNLKAQRKQYGLRPFVTSTVHASMGDTLTKIATEISSDVQSFKLWDKAQVVVLLSRTKFARDIIFVGHKKNTLKALCNLIQMKTQWQEYMESVLSMICMNENIEQYKPRYMSFKSYPFQIKDLALPVCNTGYVYMIVSTKDMNQNYIGQTMNLGRRLNQHNSGYGSLFTNNIKYRPWCLIGFVVGFNKDLNLMKYFERRWQEVRNKKVNSGENDILRLVESANIVIDSISSSNSMLQLIVMLKN